MLDPSSLPERSANSPSYGFKSKCSLFSLKLQTILVPYHNICNLLLNILCSIVPGKRIKFVKDVLTLNSMSKWEKLLYWSAELALWTQVRKETFSWMTFMLLCQELCSLNGCLWVTLGNQQHLHHGCNEIYNQYKKQTNSSECNLGSKLWISSQVVSLSGISTRTSLRCQKPNIDTPLNLPVLYSLVNSKHPYPLIAQT